MSYCPRREFSRLALCSAAHSQNAEVVKVSQARAALLSLRLPSLRLTNHEETFGTRIQVSTHQKLWFTWSHRPELMSTRLLLNSTKLWVVGLAELCTLEAVVRVWCFEP